MASGPQLSSSKISMALFRTSNRRGPESLYRLAADTFRTQTGYSRVVIYQFSTTLQALRLLVFLRRA